MSVARTTEISAFSPKSFDAAVHEGIERASESLRNVSHVWVKDHEVVLKDGEIEGYKAKLKVTFVLDS